MASCSFIGHRDFVGDDVWKEKIKRLIVELIKEFDVNSFYVEAKSNFTYFCSKIIKELKEIYSSLKLIYVWGEWMYSNESVDKSMLKFYDEILKPKCFIGAGKKIYVKRNYYIIDMCDIIVFYYDENRGEKVLTKNSPLKIKSGTWIAYDYAKTKGKKIINVWNGDFNI